MSLTKWNLAAMAGGAILVHFAVSSPLGWALGTTAGWLLSRAADPTRRRLGPALAWAAEQSLGILTGSPAQVALVDNAPPSENWCALAVMGWIRAASSRTGITPPLTGNPGALATMVQFQQAPIALAHWVPAATLHADPSLVLPGMVPVWTRPTDPPGGGHIGVVTRGVSHSTDTFQTIEGNAGGNAIAYHEHPLDAPNFLGMGQFTL